MTLPHVRSGEPIYADQYNKMVDAVNMLLSMQATPPLVLNRSMNNLRLMLADEPDVRYVQLTEDIHNDAAQGISKNEREANGVQIIYGAGSDGYWDGDDTSYLSIETYASCANVVNNGVWLEDEWLPMGKSCGKLVPLVDPGPHIAKVTTAITARSTTTIGTGEALIYEVNKSTGVISTSAHTETIKNLEDSRVNVDEYIWVRYHRQSKFWFVDKEQGSNCRRFVTTAAFDTGDASVACTMTTVAGATKETGLKVYNLLTSTASTYKFAGASGAAGWMSRSGGKWCIIEMESGGYPATLVRGLLQGACTGGTFTMDNLNWLDGYNAATSLASVANPFGMYGDDNGAVLAAWNDEDSQWEAIQMACPA